MVHFEEEEEEQDGVYLFFRACHKRKDVFKCYCHALIKEGSKGILYQPIYQIMLNLTPICIGLG